MFFAIDLLCPQHEGRFSVVWITATRGIGHVKKKEITNCDVVKLCDEILQMVLSTSTRPRLRLSLSLASRLINGLVKIHREHVKILQDDLIHYLLQVRKPPLQSSRALMDSEESDRTPVVKPLRKRKRAIVLSQEPSIILPLPVATDPGIVINEGDLSRPAIHQVDSDLITLREEMPALCTDTINMDDMRDFGVLGDGMPPPLPEFLSQTAQLLEQPQTTVQPAEVTIEPPPKRRALPRLDEIQQQVPEEIEVQTVPSKLLPNIQEIPEVLEPEGQSIGAKAQPSKEVVDIAQLDNQPTTLQKRKLHPLSKILAKTQPRRVVNINRPREDMIFPLWDYENRVPVTLVKPQLDDVDLSVIAPFMDEAEDLHQFLSVVRASLGSKASLLKSPGVTLGAPSRLTTTVEQVIEPPQAQVSQASHQFVVQADVHVPASPRPSPRIQQVAIMQPPLLETTQRLVPEKTGLHLAESTGISVQLAHIEDVMQPTIQVTDQTIELTAAGAAEIPRRKEVVVDTSPTESQILMVTKTRQRRIRDIVKEWNTDTQGTITIENVCQAPVNRRNVALAFNDLLVMQKMGYVKLNNKPDSLELGTIEEGDRITSRK